MNGIYLTAIEAIYAAAPEPSLWPHTLQTIADLFGDVGAVMVWQRDDGGFGTFSSPSIQEMVAEFNRTFNGRDLRSARAIERGLFLERDAVTDRHIVSQEEIESHSFYLMMARHQLRYFAGVSISPDPRVNVAISIQRSINGRPYEDSELQLLTRLGRHAERSLTLSIRLINAEVATIGLREALDRLTIGVFALDSLQRIVFANPAGEALLAGALIMVREQLRVAPSSGRQIFEDGLRRVLSGDPEDFAIDPKPILLERQDAQRPLTIYILPVRQVPQSSHGFLTHVRAIVLAIDPAAGEPADPAVVRDVLGITLGEARVAALIGAGHLHGRLRNVSVSRRRPPAARSSACSPKSGFRAKASWQPS